MPLKQEQPAYKHAQAVRKRMGVGQGVSFQNTVWASRAILFRITSYLLFSRVAVLAIAAMSKKFEAINICEYVWWREGSIYKC